MSKNLYDILNSYNSISAKNGGKDARTSCVLKYYNGCARLYTPPKYKSKTVIIENGELKVSDSIRALKVNNQSFISLSKLPRSALKELERIAPKLKC